MCDRCDDLEEEVAYLKSEMGLQEDLRTSHLVRTAFGISPAGVKILLRLYRAGGRVVTHAQIMEAIPPRDGGEDYRIENNIKVHISKIRKAIGPGLIQTAWGDGFSLTPAGLSLVALAIGVARPVDGAELRELSERAPEELRSLVAHLAGILAHRDGDGGAKTAATFRRIADRLTGQPRVAA